MSESTGHESKRSLLIVEDDDALRHRLGIRIGLVALAELKADRGALDVTVFSGASAPCACIADGALISTGATPGRGTLRVAPEKAPGGLFALIVVKQLTSGVSRRYAVPASARPLLDEWNTLPPGDRLTAVMARPDRDLFAVVAQ